MTDIDSQLTLVPESLQMFLRPIVKTDKRVAVWGHNFIKAIQLDHRFGSKWMFNKFYLLRYTESYTETQKYKYCILNRRSKMMFQILLVLLIPYCRKQIELSSNDQVISMEAGETNNAITQFVGDNIDLNIVSIHGNTPFHSMGWIKVTSPAPPLADPQITATVPG